MISEPSVSLVENDTGDRLDPKLGQLYIVATPIGNLQDITPRALEILSQVDLIAAEDTRHTGRLLEHFQIKTPQVSFHQHNVAQRLPLLLNRLQQGQRLALVSDAGLPGVADPGYELIRVGIDHQIAICPIPGANAALTALVASGLPMDRFTFEGFLPRKASHRRDRLQELAQESRTMILYEAPHRLRKTLRDLADSFGGDRPIVIARELTKRYEEFWRGSLTQALVNYGEKDPKGEITLVIGGYGGQPNSMEEYQWQDHLRDRLEQGIPLSQATRELAQEMGLSRRKLYQAALKLNLEN